MRAVIHQAAADDIIRHATWYQGRSVAAITRRFQTAVLRALEQLCATPESGESQAAAHPSLAGLRAWPLKGFAEFRVWYTTEADHVAVLRVLHEKRDIGIADGG